MDILKKGIDMKKALFFLMTLIITSNEYGIILKSTALKNLDGVWPAFDGITILNIAHLKTKFTSINIGQLDQTTKQRKGLYTFRKKKYSVADLAEIEKQNANDPKIQRELQPILQQVKDEFLKLNEKFIQQVQDFKDMVITLMRESCKKRNVPHSFMLNWADTQAGQEEESFQRNMTSFVKLNHFLNDLSNFLQDIYDSCPKGRKQFFEILEKLRLSKQRSSKA